MRTAMPAVLAGILLLSGCGPFPTLDELLLRPRQTLPATPADAGFDYDEITVPVAPGRSVVIWHIPSAVSKALIVAFPGSSSNKGKYVGLLWPFVDNGYDVILMDYEGYGNSPGEPTLDNAADSALAVAGYALTRHDRVVLFGISLGAPLAARAAVEYDVDALILEAPLILKQEVALYLSQLGIIWPEILAIANLLVHPQVPDAFDILKHIRQVDAPKLMLHSPADEVTPYLGGLRVFEAAPPPKEFLPIRHRHGRMIREEPDFYVTHVGRWLDATLGLQD